MSTPERYAILRIPASEPAPAPATRHRPTARAAARGGPPPRPQLEIRALDAQERARLRSDRDVKVVVPVKMRIRLIQQTAKAPPPKAKAKVANWGISAVRADTSPYTGRGVTVAVLDTGIEADHPAFKVKGLKLEQKDFTRKGAPDVAPDTDGHGTHCAGTIFGRDVGGQRIGIARGVERALIGRVLGPGGGTLENILEGIQWAVKQGADVISMSLGIDYAGYQKELVEIDKLPDVIATSRALVEYVDTVRLFGRLHDYLSSLTAQEGRSILLVAAAGNESLRDKNKEWTIAASPPANAPGFLAVAAVAGPTPKYSVAPFSNTGAALAAPGVDIVSAWPGKKLMSLDGTSMAAPHVAGVAALWAEKLLKQNGSIDAELVRSRVTGRCQDLAGLSPEDVGGGLVQAPQD